MNKLKMLGVIRHILTFAGGILITKGVIDESTTNEIIGGIIALLSAIWSVTDKQ